VRVLYGEVASVRREFAQHAVVVEGEGNWSALPGVQQVSKDANSRDGQVLYLGEGVSSDDILGEISRSPNHRIDRFEIALPSLSDIFISSVGETIESIEREHDKQKMGATNG
jgi:ABC-type uncharacterized transport system ATPase subunit